MIHVQECIDGHKTDATLEITDERMAHHNPIINSHLVTLCLTSQLSLPQSQHLDFGAKQTALQCCTKMLYLSHPDEGQGDIL